MIRYSEFAPTPFDGSGAFLEEDRQDWLVAPVSRTRDSDALAKSNFVTALEILGGESETVEVHRFGHWGPGWFEIILIDPRDTSAVAQAENVERSLEDYPVLSDEDYSAREGADIQEAWERLSIGDRADYLAEGASIFAVRCKSAFDFPAENPDWPYCLVRG